MKGGIAAVEPLRQSWAGVLKASVRSGSDAPKSASTARSIASSPCRSGKAPGRAPLLRLGNDMALIVAGETGDLQGPVEAHLIISTFCRKRIPLTAGREIVAGAGAAIAARIRGRSRDGAAGPAWNGASRSVSAGTGNACSPCRRTTPTAALTPVRSGTILEPTCALTAARPPRWANLPRCGHDHARAAAVLATLTVPDPGTKVFQNRRSAARSLWRGTL